MLYFITAVVVLGCLVNADPIKKCQGEYDMVGKTYSTASDRKWTEYDAESNVTRECECQEYRELLYFDCGDHDYCSTPTKTCNWEGCETEVGGQFEPWYQFPYTVHKPYEWIITYPSRCLCYCVKPSEAEHTTQTADAPEKPYIWDCECKDPYYYDDEEVENEIEDKKRRKRSINV